MQQSFCDGLSVSYNTNSDSTTHPRRSCTTQSVDNPGDYSTLEGIYTPSPTLSGAETAQQPAHYLPAINTAAAVSQNYPLPQIHSANSTSRGMWPTPPATACEDFEDYTYQASPTGPSCFPIGPTQSSGTSPRSWSSPDAQQLNFQQVVWKGQELPSNSMRFATTPTEDRFHRQMVASPYTNSSAFLPNTIEQDSIMSQEAPPMTPDHPESALSPRSVSPPLKHEYGYSYDEDDAPQTSGQGEGGSDGEDASKVDEPYAQLIYKAFMSRERRAMTLQEIYQWFRDNTDKAKSESKGWQNSIRHNLSMNAAFVKKDKKPSAHGPTTESGEAKKSTEWVLEEWAIREGVQSTTRYRKGTSTRRGGSRSEQRSRGTPLHSARVRAGRKGGLIASSTKATRAALHQRRFASQISLPRSRFNGRNLNYGVSGSNEPMTPPDVSSGQDYIFPDPLNRAQGYYFNHPLLQPQYQHSHLQHHPHPNPTTYSLENVSGVYQPPPSLPGQAARGQPQYSMLFADDRDDETPESSVRVTSMNSYWPENGPPSYQASQ